jgi:hypothetical protein
MPNGPIIVDAPLNIGYIERVDDHYREGVSISIGDVVAVIVRPKIALEIADGIINTATAILNQSAAACGCDAKADWTCERHRAPEEKTVES